VEQVLGGDPETDPPPQPAEEDRKRLGGFGGGGGRGPGMNGIQPMPGLTDFQKRELTQQRAGLILLIGRLQREKLGDGAAAVATLARMVEVVPEFQGDLAGLLPGLAADVALRRAHKEVKHDVGRGLMILNEFDVMEELARTQEKSGQADEAILTLARLCTAYLHTRDDGVDEALANMTRLIEKSPKIAAMAGAGELVKLTPAPVAVAKVAQTTEAFVNAASPFAWTRTNLGDFKLGAVAVRDFARLADGRWIGALAAGVYRDVGGSGDVGCAGGTAAQWRGEQHGASSDGRWQGDDLDRVVQQSAEPEPAEQWRVRAVADEQRGCQNVVVAAGDRGGHRRLADGGAALAANGGRALSVVVAGGGGDGGVARRDEGAVANPDVRAAAVVADGPARCAG
jgi:hypothetical protein